MLAQPTRAQLFARLSTLHRPAETEELARELHLHPSGVRAHLAMLHEAGLVAKGRAPSASGRPRTIWTVASEAQPGSEHPDAYRVLARWLARSVGTRPSVVREVERSGRDLGRGLPLRPDGSNLGEAMGRSLTALGFAPRRAAVADSDGREQLRFVLGSCPYRDAVRENQTVVCALHRGLTTGLIDTLDPAARMTAFVPKDPDLAGCEITLVRRARAVRRRSAPSDSG